MKCSGYAASSDELVDLGEITIQADPDALRKLADFIRRCADEIEVQGDDWEHEHFQDSPLSESVDASTDVIVFRRIAE